MKNRIILAIDFDAFYCGVDEKFDPTLIGVPFIVAQKNCVATLSYAARALGLKKLGFVSDAVRQFPLDRDIPGSQGQRLRVVNGENLARYRREAKRIFKFVRTRLLPADTAVQRLGLEEMWVDVTDIVERNLERLLDYGSHLLFQSLEQGAEVDDAMGEGWRIVMGSGEPQEDCEDSFVAQDFFFSTPAKTIPEEYGRDLPRFLAQSENDAYLDLKLYIGSHIANHMMERIISTLGYSCSMGVATNKTLAKMVCSVNKPKGLTMILSSSADVRRQFIQDKPLRKIPGFGGVLRKAIQTSARGILKDMPDKKDYDDKFLEELIASRVRAFFEAHGGLAAFVKGVSTAVPEPRAVQLWALLVGDDDGEVPKSNEDPAMEWVPKSQLSVEDSYGKVPAASSNVVRREILTTRAHVYRELVRLTRLLIVQIFEDLLHEDTGAWLAYPASFRLTVRDWRWAREAETSASYVDSGAQSYMQHRFSRSCPITWDAFYRELPALRDAFVPCSDADRRVFASEASVDTKKAADALVSRLVDEYYMPLYDAICDKASPKNPAIDVNILNVGVVGLQKTRPTTSTAQKRKAEDLAESSAKRDGSEGGARRNTFRKKRVTLTSFFAASKCP